MHNAYLVASIPRMRVLKEYIQLIIVEWCGREGFNLEINFTVIAKTNCLNKKSIYTKNPENFHILLMHLDILIESFLYFLFKF